MGSQQDAGQFQDAVYFAVALQSPAQGPQPS
jgi:hypothetical protein